MYVFLDFIIFHIGFNKSEYEKYSLILTQEAPIHSREKRKEKEEKKKLGEEATIEEPRAS